MGVLELLGRSKMDLYRSLFESTENFRDAVVWLFRVSAVRRGMLRDVAIGIVYPESLEQVT
jgi:hypothetical protein